MAPKSATFARARRNGPWIVLGCVAVLLAIRTHTLASAWATPLSFAQLAVREAPLKPRPWVNYGTALVGVGRFQDARTAFEMARRTAKLPHVPEWDRRTALAVTEQNLTTLTALEAFQR